MVNEVNYTFFVIYVHIRTECVDMSEFITIDKGFSSLLWILLLNGSLGCIQSSGIHWCMRKGTVSLDGVLPRSLLASVSGLFHIAHQDGPSFDRVYHIVHFCVDCIVGCSDMDVLHGLSWCRG
jgi:hypothetical protein